MPKRKTKAACVMLLPFALASWAQVNLSAPDKPASLEGTVTHAATGAPIERAHVIARQSTGGPQQQVYGTSSNAEGKFVVGGLPAGNYTVTVERSGFLMPVEHNSIGAFSKLDAGEKKDVKLRLIPAGAILGRVLDEDDNPVVGATVSLDQGMNGGPQATTDEKGQFRLSGLAPGRYRVKAKVANVMPVPAEIRTDGTKETFNIATFYPGTTDRTSAAKVSVQSGLDVNGIDIKMVRSPVIHISGKIAGMSDTVKNYYLQVQEEGGMYRNGAPVKPDGSFVLWRVDPGKIRLVASGNEGGRNRQGVPLDVEVGQQDIENLQPQFAEPEDIAGQITFEDEQAKPQAPPAQQNQTQNRPKQTGRISLYPVGGAYGSVESSVGEDGSFVLKTVTPDRYKVALSWKTGYVRSMRLGNVDIEGSILDLRTMTQGAPLGLSVSSGLAEVDGTVTDSNGPVARAMVYAVPELRVNGVQPLFTYAGPDGSYKLAGLTPGKYTIFAVDDDDSTVWSVGAENYEDIAEKLDLQPKDRIVRDLKRRSR